MVDYYSSPTPAGRNGKRREGGDITGKHRPSGLWALLLLAAVGILLLAARWRESGFQWSLFAATLREVDPRWVGASAVLSLLTYYGRALRWAVMLRPLKPRPSLAGLFVATAIGFTAVVLFGRPGELVRPYLIAQQERVSFASQLAAWLLERVYDLLVVLLIFGLALTHVEKSSAQVGPALAWTFQVGGYMVGLAGAACLIFLVLMSRFSETTVRKVLAILRFFPAKHRQRLESLLLSFLDGMRVTRSGECAVQIVFYTIVEWVVIVACFMALLRAFPATAGLGLTGAVILLGFVAFGSVVQIPGVGGGMQLVAILVLTEIFGTPLEVASGVGILLWVVTFVIIVPFGLLLALRTGINWRRIRILQTETPP